MRAATWVGNRRWDLTFDSGETLALPEEGARELCARLRQQGVDCVPVVE